MKRCVRENFLAIPFIPTDEFLGQLEGDDIPMPYDKIWEHIVRGGYPVLHSRPSMPAQAFFASYISTYVELV